MTSSALKVSLVVFFAVAAGSWARAEDVQSTELIEDMEKYGFKTVTTKEGLHFNVPEDMPIVSRDGITAPISFDQYLYIKFRQMQEKLGQIDEKMGRIEKSLTSLQEKLQRSGLVSSGPASGSSSS